MAVKTMQLESTLESVWSDLGAALYKCSIHSFIFSRRFILIIFMVGSETVPGRLRAGREHAGCDVSVRERKPRESVNPFKLHCSIF